MPGSIPPTAPPPDSPQPGRGEPWFPHVVAQASDGRGSVLVTFAMPDLTTATIRVPQSAWLQGLHLQLPPALVSLMFPPQPGPDEYAGEADADVPA